MQERKVKGEEKMKRSLLCVFTLCVSIGLTGLAQAQDLKVLWKERLRMESADKSVQFRSAGGY